MDGYSKRYLMRKKHLINSFLNVIDEQHVLFVSMLNPIRVLNLESVVSDDTQKETNAIRFDKCFFL